MKPLLPSDRQKQRYIIFRIKQSAKMPDFKALKSMLLDSFIRLHGLLDLAASNIFFTRALYDEKTGKGLIKIDRKYINHLRSVFCFPIDSKSLYLESVIVSGSIEKAKSFLKGGI